MTLELKQVFTPGGVPSITYVDRQQLKLEDRIRNAVTRGFAFNVVTGATKSGKSVLCHRALAGHRIVTVEGGLVGSEGEFWQLIAHQLDLAESATKALKTGDKFGTEANAGFEFGIKAGGKATSETSSDRTTSVTYSTAIKLACIEALLKENAVLLIDDFHYVEQSIQRSVIQGLKGAVMRGLTVFLLAVPHRAFDPVTVENEVEGRFKHVEIPDWDQHDLIKIPQQGFKALKLDVSNEVCESICEQSFGNPLLVQEACSEFAIANGVNREQPSLTKLDESKLKEAFTEMANSKGFPKFQKLKKGPDARKARQLRTLNDGTQEDIYSAIMRAIARTGPQPRLTYDEIRASLKVVMGEGRALPQKHEITSALSHMSAIAKKEIKGEPPLEWVKDAGELVITDPFLLFYMRHGLAT